MAERLTLARPYAQAVFETAQKTHRLQPWSAALNAAAAVVADAQVAALLNHPAVARATLVDLITAAVERGGEADAAGELGQTQGQNFLRLLAENRRLGLLPEIAALFDEFKNAAEDSVDVEAVSAVELTDDARAALVASLQQRLGHRVRLSSSVDPDLVGGAVVKAADLVIDGSVRNRLNKLAQALIR